MAPKQLCCFALFFFLNYLPVNGILLIVPEDVAQGLVAFYGFSPRILQGNDHRLGFGFRFGNHADFQVMYELGPQTTTKQQPSRVRSATYRKRVVRRRPIVDLLLRAGLLKEESYEVNVGLDRGYDEPR